MWVIYQITSEKEYGYGGWKDNYVEYFEVIAVADDEDKAKVYVGELEAKEEKRQKKRNSLPQDISYGYSWAEKI